MMSQSNFTLLDMQSQLKRTDGEHAQLFDPVRKKWITETPEELVRQCLILWLNQFHAIPFNRMAVEKQIQVFSLTKRFDLVIYGKSALPFILIECKSPQMSLQQKMFDQAAVYNMKLQAPYLGICNGLDFKFCHIDFEQKIYQFISELPTYPF